MKRRSSSFFGAGVLAVSSLVVACGGDDTSAGLTGPAGGSAGAAGKATGGAAGKAGGAAGKGGTAAGAAGKAGGAGKGGATGGSAGTGAGGNGVSGAAGKATGGSAGAGGAAGTATGGSAGSAGKATGGAGGLGGSTGGGGTAGAGGKAVGGAGGSAGAAAGSTGTGGTVGGQAGAGGVGTGGTAGNGTAGAAGDGASGAAGDGSSGAAGDGGGAGAGGDGSAGAGTGGAGTGGAGASGASGAAGAPGGCVGTDTACNTAAGNKGLCRNSVCAACADPADDAACGTAYVAGDLCLAGACGKCDAVGSTYFVDPVNGSDTVGTGSGAAGGVASSRCAFKTVANAILHIGANAAGATLVISVAGPSKLDATEKYPLKVPPKTTVTTTGGNVVVALTANARAFDLTKDGASLDGGTFLIDIDAEKQGGTKTAGVFVGTGATDATRIRHVRISDTVGAAIAVTGTGRVTIEEGVHLRRSGRGTGTVPGLAIGDPAGFATLEAPAGSDPILIEECGNGIAVTGGGGIKIAGVPDAASTDKGTIVVQKNLGPGIVITQGGLLPGPAPLCDVFGVVSFGNGTANAGSGLRVSYTSNVRLRSSVFLANKTHGVHVIAADVGLLAFDMGTASEPGLNVVQRLNVQGSINLGTGICLSPGNGANLTIPARGNVFGTGKDCSTTAATLVQTANGPNACASGRDIGIDTVNPTNNIDVSLCK